MKALVFIMLFMFSMGPVFGQTLERSTFFNRCQEDAPPGPSEADVANLYMNQCPGLVATVVKTESMSGNDCDWEVEYTYDVKCGDFEEQIKIGYVGGDRTPPELNEGAEVPAGGSNLDLCFNDAPLGPTEAEIAALYSDNCLGDVTVVKFGAPEGDDCSWTANYKYQITDACGNPAAELDVNYSGSDQTPPALNKNAEIPQGNLNSEACFLDKNQGPSEEEIAMLYSDNCGGPVFVEKTSYSKGTDCKWVAVYDYTIRDLCGNFAEPLQIVFQGSDQEDPMLDGVPVNTTVSCIDEIPEPAQVVAFDNCSEGKDLTLTFEEDDSQLGLACAGGVLVRTWTATDFCGRSVSATQEITVLPAPMAQFEEVADDTITCEEAYNFQAGDLSYSNGVSKGACSIMGSVTGNATPDFTVCGGTITVNWTYTDECQREINAQQLINVIPAPEAQVSAPELPDSITCADAATYTPLDATYSNNLDGLSCGISGSLTANVERDYDACGGKLTITYNGQDECGRPLSAGPYEFDVEQAPEADITVPEFPDSIACADAAGYEAADATYSNGLEGTACEISGSITATVEKDYDACGGKITVTYNGQDECGRPLSAGPYEFDVEQAPEALVSKPEFPDSFSCQEAIAFVAGDATYSNGLEGTACEISGIIEATVSNSYGKCGGSITVSYDAEDACGRPLSAGPYVITVNPAPEADITLPEFPESIACADAAEYEVANATYSNGLEGTGCELSGSIEPIVDVEYDACGGKITINYIDKDQCDRDLIAGPFEILIDAAPEADITVPEFPDSIACADAAGYEA
ncbi:hypothetical protein, partial [uncultured Psychroserpens sp.]|uniref:HYR-like domain-containing protein n=1 Tax=uncultured Psychroserpens sp. TaxID=255436 RepID=UPI0026153AD2